MSSLRIRVLSLSMSIFASFSAFGAGFEGAMLDPAAFASEARKELGLEAFENGRLLFQDSAYRSDQEPVDGAALVYLSDRKATFSDGTYFLSYRLKMSNGALDIVYVQISNQFRRVADGRDLGILLPTGASPEHVNQAVELLTQQFPNARVTSIPRIRLVRVSWDNPNALQLKEVVELAHEKLSPRSLRMESELYPIPFIFGNVFEISVDGGKVDLDSKRDVCKVLLTKGLQFTTSSSIIPERFK